MVATVAQAPDVVSGPEATVASAFSMSRCLAYASRLSASVDVITRAKVGRMRFNVHS